MSGAATRRRFANLTRKLLVPCERERPSAFPLLDPEADEKDPDREHRAEHTEDDARCY
jgi:hypothetical protein